MECAYDIYLRIKIWDHTHTSIQYLSILFLRNDCVRHLIILIKLDAGVTLRLNIFICFNKLEATIVDFVLLFLCESCLQVNVQFEESEPHEFRTNTSH